MGPLNLLWGCVEIAKIAVLGRSVTQSGLWPSRSGGSIGAKCKHRETGARRPTRRLAAATPGGPPLCGLVGGLVGKGAMARLRRAVPYTHGGGPRPPRRLAAATSGGRPRRLVGVYPGGRIATNRHEPPCTAVRWGAQGPPSKKK